MALLPHRDDYVHTIASWTFLNDRSPVEPHEKNIAREFAGMDMPKNKFMFTVSFETDFSIDVNPGNDDLSLIEYDCKTATRPNLNWTTQEVNAYNYRFKVKTKLDYGTVTVAFYDDNKNTAHNLFRNYLMATSPIARREAGNSYYDNNAILQQWASLGPLPNESPDGLIRTLRVTHHYVDNDIDSSTTHQAVYYDYINPKVQNFVLDDLDMSASDPPLITITFVYDSVHISYSDPKMDTYRTTTVGNVTVGGPETVR